MRGSFKFETDNPMHWAADAANMMDELVKWAEHTIDDHFDDPHIYYDESGKALLDPVERAKLAVEIAKGSARLMAANMLGYVQERAGVDIASSIDDLTPIEVIVTGDE
jgi:hypothetical protein